MMRKLILCLFLACAFGLPQSYGQGLISGVTCPPNIDFEFGNLSYWNFWNGTCTSGPVYTLSPSAPVISRESLVSGGGLDPFGYFPVVPPGGGAYALKLGDTVTGTLTEKAAYYVHVPSGSTHYALIYRYAVVLEDPSHGAPDQPRFTVTATDSTTGKPVPCALYNYIAGSLPGFLSSPRTSSEGVKPFYKPWATGTINLAGMAGHTVSIEVIAQDCTQGGHFGYGYVDLSCGLYAIDAKICDDTLATLTGPSGFSSYTWYDSSTFTFIPGGTSQVLTIPIPDSATTFAVVLTPFVGFGCPDTLYTRVQPSYLKLNPNPSISTCKSNAVTLLSNATDSAIAMPLTYSWSPALYLSCTNCDNPVATPNDTTIYTVTVTDKAGCSKTASIKVNVDTVKGALSIVNDSCAGSNNGSAKFIPTSGQAPYSYVWHTTPIQTGDSASTLVAGTYSVTVTDKAGCQAVHIAKVTAPPARNLSIVASAGPTKCFGNDGYIALAGMVSGTLYTITYTFNGLPTLQYRTANTTGNDTLLNLAAGIYDHITIDVIPLGRSFCPFNTVGPITLIDPPVPPLPAVGNNGPLCIGDTLKLTANDAMLGVRYDWTGPGGFIWNLADTAIANADNTNGGVYTVTVTKNACSSSGSTTVIIKPFPILSAVGDTVCSGSDAHLAGASANGADAYRWDGPNAYSAFTKTPTVNSVDTFATGTYTLTATLAGCKATTTASITVVQTPAAPGVHDTVYCQYDSPVPALRADGTSLTWYSGTGSLFPGVPTPTTTGAGTFTWMVDQRIAGPGVTNPVVCISPKATTTVKVNAKSDINLSFVSDSAVCTGAIVTFIADGLGEDKTRLRWSFAEGDTLDNVNPAKHGFSSVGTFTITATATHEVCATNSTSQVIHVYPYPVISLGEDTSICLGSKSITLGDHVNDGNPKARWIWNTGETTPSIVVTKPGVYYATLFVDGCPVTDTVTVLNDCFMSVPNAFSPDGDGLNDYFMPRQFLTKGLETFSMDIFNRWGQLVFATKNINGIGWDGKFNGVPQPEGVYIYEIKATFKDGQIENHTGNLTLLK